MSSSQQLSASTSHIVIEGHVLYYLLCVECNVLFMLYMLQYCSVVSLLQPAHSLLWYTRKPL